MSKSSLISKLRRFVWRLLGPQTASRSDYVGPHGCVRCAASFIAWNQVPGDYLEFGVYRGDSFAEAYRAVSAERENVRRIIGGEEIQRWYENKPRFIAFDSFAGLPGNAKEKHIDYAEGSYACSEEEFLENIQAAGVKIDDVVTVPGYYDETLNNEMKRRLSLTTASVILIDCDLYESTVPVLDFITDIVTQGTILIFDDWYRFRGSPNSGEQRACREWLQRNSQIELVQYWQQGPQSVAFLVNTVSQPSS